QRTPKLAGVQAVSWAMTIDAGRTTYTSGPDVKTGSVQPGTLPITLQGAAIAALPDSLPGEVSIWLYDFASGDASPTIFRFGKREMIEVRVAREGVSCEEGSNTDSKELPVVWVTAQVGARREEFPVLAHRPHLRVPHDITKCARLPKVELK